MAPNLFGHFLRQRRSLVRFRFRPGAETLEPRCTPACCTTSLSGGVLTITGNSSANTLELDIAGTDYVINLCGQTESRPLAGVTAVEIYAGDGNDTITLRKCQHPVTVYAGDGDDTITVGEGDLDSVNVMITVYGGGHGAPGDTLNINDSTHTVARSLTGTETADEEGTITAAGLSPFQVSYYQVRPVYLYGGSGQGNIFQFFSLAMGPPRPQIDWWIITAAGSTNEVVLGSLSGALDLPFSVMVSGGAASSNSLLLQAPLSTADHLFTVTADAVTRSGSGSVFFENMQAVTLAVGAASPMSVFGTAAGTAVTVSGAASVEVGQAGSVQAVQGPLTVLNLSGLTALTLDDSADPLGRAVTLGAGQVIGLAPAPVSWLPAALASLTVHGGAGGNVFTLADVAIGYPATVNAGAGDDVIRLLPVAAERGLTVHGQGGLNTLDYSAYAGGVYVNLLTLTASDVTGVVSGIHNVLGGTGDDVLVGDAADNRLAGGPGRDLLIGGAGADRLGGGGGEDILIGGTTRYDEDPATLLAIRMTWGLPDLSYLARIDLLRSLLNPMTVLDDESIDTLLGGPELDWFSASAADVTDRDPFSEELI